MHGNGWRTQRTIWCVGRVLWQMLFLFLFSPPLHIGAHNHSTYLIPFFIRQINIVFDKKCHFDMVLGAETIYDKCRTVPPRQHLNWPLISSACLLNMYLEKTFSFRLWPVHSIRCSLHSHSLANVRFVWRSCGSDDDKWYLFKFTCAKRREREEEKTNNFSGRFFFFVHVKYIYV